MYLIWFILPSCNLPILLYLYLLDFGLDCCWCAGHTVSVKARVHLLPLFYISVNFISSRCSHNSYNYLTLCQRLASGECCSITLSLLNVFFCPSLGLFHHFNFIPWDESFPPSSLLPPPTTPFHRLCGF